MWVDYSPPYLVLYVLAGAAYLGVVAALARLVPRGMVVITAFALIQGVIAYSAYHATHDEPRYVQDFTDVQRVTPYHEQLALPAFATLAAGFVIALVTWSRSRRASAAPG